MCDYLKASLCIYAFFGDNLAAGRKAACKRALHLYYRLDFYHPKSPVI